MDDGGLAEAVDLIRALGDADTAEALNAALSRALTGIYAGVSDGRLGAEFELHAPEGVPYLLRHAQPVGLDAESRCRTPAKPCATPW